MKRSCLTAMGVVVCLLCGSIGADGAAETRFSLVVREGFGSIRVGDLNTTLSSASLYYDALRESYPDQVTGKLSQVPDHFRDWEVELQWRAGRRLSVGLAVSAPAHYRQSSSASFFHGYDIETKAIESEIRAAAPIRLNLYYSLPIRSRLNLLINGGVGYYHARLTQTDQYRTQYFDYSSSLTYHYFNVTGNGIGVQCGLALEYKIGERFSMIAEGVWRLAKIRSLKGAGTNESSTYDENGDIYSSSSDSIDGQLYHFTHDGASVALAVLEAPPEIFIDGADCGKASLNLGGFTFKIGLRIGLF